MFHVSSRTFVSRLQIPILAASRRHACHPRSQVTSSSRTIGHSRDNKNPRHLSTSQTSSTCHGNDTDTEQPKTKSAELETRIQALGADVGDLRRDVGDLGRVVGDLGRVVGDLRRDVDDFGRVVGDLRRDVDDLRRQRDDRIEKNLHLLNKLVEKNINELVGRDVNRPRLPWRLSK